MVMELLGSTVVFFVAMFVTLQRNTLSAGLAGVSITYALQVNNDFRFSSYQYLHTTSCVVKIPLDEYGTL